MKVHNKQAGFTLIELLIVLGVVAILATLAVPSYRSYMINNRQQEVKADMLKFSGELEQWRSKSLTYAGYIPKSVASSSVASFNYPVNSNNSRYQIWVYSFVKRATTGYTISDIKGADIGLNWLMVATPTANDSGLNSYLMSSNGIKCSTTKKADLAATKVSALITNRNCGTFSGDWK